MLFNFSSGLSEGDDVTYLLLKDTDQQPVDFSGKWTILYFYPMNDTPGCIAQAIGYSNLIVEFNNIGAQVIAINTGSEVSHSKFKEKYNLKVRQISDKKGKLAKAFGIRLLIGICARDTIVINPEGKVEAIFRGVNPKSDPEKMLNFIKDRK
jgi:thioredoxin-dependent peroxiredoxin